LVRARGVHVGELRQDLVPLVHVALVELVMGFDRRPRDAVHLEELGFELARRDFLVIEDQGGHASPFPGSSVGGVESLSFPRCPNLARSSPAVPGGSGGRSWPGSKPRASASSQPAGRTGTRRTGTRPSAPLRKGASSSLRLPLRT